MSPGGGGNAGANQEEEERRKSALRARIDALYGISSTEPLIEKAKGGGGLLGLGTGGGGLFNSKLVDDLNQQTAAQNSSAATTSADAATSMEAEKTKLADATRGYYTDELGDQYAKAERNTRFKLARQGLLGGSEDVYQQGDVREDRDMGATRVDESVRRAIASLTGQREQERLNAINLVNAGAGDSAVSAAQAGLRNSFENVASQQKADIFGDLFTGSADAVTGNNLAAQQAAQLGLYRDRLSTFFPTRSTSSGRVTPS